MEKEAEEKEMMKGRKWNKSVMIKQRHGEEKRIKI